MERLKSPEAWVQEPTALEEHRLRRVEAMAMTPKRRYTSFGPLHSVRDELGSDFRLHNRWLQLSMQCDANAAVAEFRNAARKSSKPRPSHKTATRNEMQHLCLQSLHPGGRLRVAWDSLALFLLFLDACLLPVSFAWEWEKDTSSASSTFLLVIFMVGVVFWSLDIFLNFNTSYFAQGSLITSQRQIAKHYLFTWFVLDASLVVLDYFTAVHTLMEDSFVDLTYSRLVRILRITRLVRLVKMAKIEGVLQEFAASTGRQWVMLLVTFFNTSTFILLFEHIASCAWFGLAHSELGTDRWIDVQGTAQSLPVVQYLHAFRYMMMPISPPQIATDNLLERVFDIVYTCAWCILLWTTFSRILARIFEQTAMNESKSVQRREIRRFLRAQEASFHLVARVMNFVDYKLDKLSLINFDQSLISDTLLTELCVNQRARYLEAVPVCKVTKGLFPDCFALICTVLKKMVCENGEDVYVAGGMATCLYITATGEYSFIEGYDRDGDAEDITGIHPFEELSLYVDNLPHHSYLIAKTFAEMYILEGDDLVESLKNTPGCAAMFFEYAREYTSTMHRIGGRVDRKASQSIAERCCKMTRVYQEIFPDQKFKLSNISSSEDMLRSDSSLPLGQIPSSEKRGISWLLREGWLEDLEESILPTQLRTCLAELHPETGSHMIFEQPQDRDRAESSCISILALLANRYEIFTRPQDIQSRLKHTQWEQLQEIINWVRPSLEEIHAVLVLLAIRALGKSKFVLCQVPSHNRRPESAVLYLVEFSSNVVPSIKELSDKGLTFVKMALKLHEVFNFAQMLQGENVPANVAQLQELVSKQGEHAIRFYVLFLLGFMSGLEAGSGSRFLTAQRADNIIEAIGMLQHLMDSTPRGIYWAYLCARARALNLPRQTPEDLVLIRIACLMRIHPENNCFNQLVTTWNRLGEAEKQTLTDHFLADGIDEVAFVFEFLPDCVNNAMKNPIVTLLGLLEVLEELLQTLQPAVAMNPDLKDAKIINVDLADMSEFIKCVQNHFVFETCVSRCKIRFAGRRAQCEMTGGNWGRIHEADSDLTSLAYCVRDVMQRQQTVESHLSKLQRFVVPKAPTTFSI